MLKSGWLSRSTHFGFKEADFPIVMNDYNKACRSRSINV